MGNFSDANERLKDALKGGAQAIRIQLSHTRLPDVSLLEKLLKGTPQKEEVMAKVKELKKQNVSIRNIEEVEKVGIDKQSGANRR